MLRCQRWANWFHRVILTDHPAGIAAHQRIRSHRQAVLFPHQILHVELGLEMAFARECQRLAQVAPGFHQLHLDTEVAREIRHAGLHPVRLLTNHAHIHTHRLTIAVIALGIARHFLSRHMDVGIPQPQPLKHMLLHRLRKRLAQLVRTHEPQQANAGIGVGAAGTGKILRLPLFYIGEQLAVALYLVGNLQRKMAGGVRGQIDQADPVHGAAAQLRKVTTDRIAERKRPLHFRIGGEGCGEGLAHRTDLEQRMFGNRFVVLLGNHPQGEQVGLAIDRERQGHAGDIVGFHHRLHDLDHQALDASGINLRQRSGRAYNRQAQRKCAGKKTALARAWEETECGHGNILIICRYE